MKIKVVEITKDDVTEEFWENMRKRFGICDKHESLNALNVCLFVEHDMVVRENYGLKAELKELKDSTNKAIKATETEWAFLKSVLG